MKHFLKVFPLCILLVSMLSCNGNPKGEKVETGEAQEVPSNAKVGDKFLIDTATSKINWTGSKLSGSSHSGFIRLSEGQLFFEKGKLSGGSFTIDMNTIENEDLADNPDRKVRLENHLKGADFFELETYPEGKFEITKVAEITDQPEITHKISGNLSLKGITKAIEIPAKLSLNKKELTAETPPFVINRTEWNVMFHSGLLGTAKDRIINDNVSLTISLKASAS